MQRAARHQISTLLLLLAAAIVVAVVAGVALDLTPSRWIGLAMATSIVFWVGGAVGGHVTIARLLDRGTPREVVEYTRTLLFMIPRFFVPCGFIAVACGLSLVAIHRIPFTSYQVLLPIALFALTTVVGITVSAPGYTRLLRAADAPGARDDDIIRRLMPLAWINRIELALVTSLGFSALASLL